MAHVKPKNRRTWDAHGEVGFNIGTSMEHHRCFNVYIVKTRATRVSDSIFFKHQYITNPQVTPETLVLKAAAELTSALKGTVSRETETADALAKVSELFAKIAEASQRQRKERQGTNKTQTALTQQLVEQYHLQGWSSRRHHLQGCKSRRWMIVAYWVVEGTLYEFRTHCRL